MLFHKETFYLSKNTICLKEITLLDSVITFQNKNKDNKIKNKNITLLEQFQNQIEAKSIPLTHIYMTAHFPGLVQALQYKVTVLN